MYGRKEQLFEFSFIQGPAHFTSEQLTRGALFIEVRVTALGNNSIHFDGFSSLFTKLFLNFSESIEPMELSESIESIEPVFELKEIEDAFNVEIKIEPVHCIKEESLDEIGLPYVFLLLLKFSFYSHHIFVNKVNNT